MSDRSPLVAEAESRSIPHNLKLLSPLLEHPDFRLSRDPEYFSPWFTAIHSPLHIPQMDRAVELLLGVMETHGSILLLGDRDVDGVTSTALLGSFLRENHVAGGGALEMVVSDEGDDYGLTGTIFQRILASAPDLVILLDMGSSHGEQIERLLDAGSRVIVLDHHQIQSPPSSHPRCAFVNPLNSANLFETEGKLATVGIVFKFLMAYGFRHTREWKIAHFLPVPGGEGGYLYRLGLYLGHFESESLAREALREKDLELVVLGSHRDVPFRFSDGEMERIRKDPVDGGKLLLSIQIRCRPRLRQFLYESADLVAVGMVTDMMPIVGENRALVRLGLGLMDYPGKPGERPYRPGYTALLECLRLDPGQILSRDLGWSIGPTLNAAGRMGQTSLALELLLSTDPEQAKSLARRLLRLNESRRSRTASNESIVEKHLEENPEKIDKPVIICFHPDMEPGVSGIIATRLVEKYGKPAIIINPDGAYARGSARSCNGYNVLSLLESAREHMIQYGGHAEAAGFSIDYERIPRLESMLLESVSAWLEGQDSQDRSAWTGGIGIVPHLVLQPGQLGWRLFEELSQLEPFGAGNPEVVIGLAGVRVTTHKFMSDGRHVRFRVDGGVNNVDCIAWRQGERFSTLMEEGGALMLYGSLELDRFAGRRKLQFRVEAMEKQRADG